MFGNHHWGYSHQPYVMPMRSFGQGSMLPIHPDSRSVFCLGESDVSFIENNKLPFDAPQLRRTMNSTNPHDCMKHMKIQEYLRDNYGRKIDDTTYEKNYKNAYKNRR